MIHKGKYQSWGVFLKTRREKHFRSAREFCTRSALGISYPQYSRYEAGDQIPSLAQALALGERLQVPIADTVIEWCRAQLPSHEKLAQEIMGQLLVLACSAGLSSAEKPTHEANGGRFRALCHHYRGVFNFVHSFGSSGVPMAEVPGACGLEMERTEQMLGHLAELGVIHVEHGHCRSRLISD
jgi:hypothetical protein